jgi:hypothetical protein
MNLCLGKNAGRCGDQEILQKGCQPMQPLAVKRKRQRFMPDSSRVITRFFGPGGQDRQKRIIQRILSVSNEKQASVLDAVMRDFSDRHRDLEKRLLRHYQMVEYLIESPDSLNYDRRLLIGAYFTKEYSLESAAFFNPSIVAHPNQSNVPKGGVRVIFSFRAVGEGHISSLTFRSGILDKDQHLMMAPVSAFVEIADIELNPTYDKKVFLKILRDELECDEIIYQIFDPLPETFEFRDMNHRIETFCRDQILTGERRETIEMIYWVARSNFV